MSDAILQNLIVLVLVFVVTGFLAYSTRTKKVQHYTKEAYYRIYRFHKVYMYLLVFAIVIVNSIPWSIIILFPQSEAAKEFQGNNLKSSIIFLIAVTMIVLSIGIVFNSVRIYFEGDHLVKKTVLGKTRFPINRIYKIVDRASEGNPIAAMTVLYARIHGKKRKLVINSMLDGYDTLVAEIRYQAPKAIFVRK